MKTVIVRMTEAQREMIQEAADADLSSVNRFMLVAALRASRHPTPATGLTPPGEAEDALAALVAMGLHKSDAAGKVNRVLTKRPKATADEIVAGAFKTEGV